MPNYGVEIRDIVAGDDVQVTRTVTSVPASTTITKAWFTVKAAGADADPGVFQKAITTSDVAGTGQITDSGADGTGALRFDLTKTNTALLTPGVEYLYDIQVLLSNGNIATIEQGVIIARRSITAATS